MGYLDAEGYLYLGDRKTDMILSGGQNIYPAEVEAALESHPRIQSSAVIGLPDDDLGQRVHAIVEISSDITADIAADVAAENAGNEATNAPLSLEAIREWLGERLVGYKHPRSLECVSHPLRDEAGKIRRVRLREERLGTTRAPGKQ